MDDLIEKTIEQQFHGIDYIIKIAASVDLLSLEVEQRNTGDLWRNTFQSTYLEEITAKTGNFKKYHTFLKMLMSGFNKQSDSVIVDILTFQDLEQLKQKKQHQGMTQSKLNPSNKRYLILSYIVEFDKVHYPLPLNFDESPPPDQLKQTIAKLRAEVDQIRAQQQYGQNVENIKNENDILKNKLKKMEETFQKLNDTNMNQAQFQRQIDDQQKEIIFLKSNIENKDRELIELRNQLHRIKNDSSVDIQESQRRYQEAERMVYETSKRLELIEEEFSAIVNENQQLKQIEKKQKARISQLEQELASVIQNKRNTTQSPSMRKSTSLNNNRMSPYQMLRKSADKQTPKRTNSRKNSVDSDTESSYMKKNKVKASPKVSNKKPIQSQSQTYKVRNQSPVQQKKGFQQKKIQKVVPPPIYTETEEEERLRKKLEELKQRNKENQINYTPTTIDQNKKQIKQKANDQEDMSTLNDRLNKLYSLMQMAKQN